MANYLPPGCFAKPIEVGGEKFETIWHARSMPEYMNCEVGKVNSSAWKDYLKNFYSTNWYGTSPKGHDIKSAEEMMRLKEHKPLAEKIRTLSKIVPELYVPRRKMKRFRSFDDGEEVDVDRYLDDKSDYWIRYKRTQAEGIGYVSIWVDIAANCDITAEKMLWRGVAASALAEALDSQGHSVEIRCFHYGRKLLQNCEGRTLVSFPAKVGTDKMVLEKICIPLCIGGFFRTWGFKSLYRRNDYKTTNNLGFHNLPSPPKEALLAGANDIFVEDIWSEQAAKDFLVREVDRLKNKLKGVDCYA